MAADQIEKKGPLGPELAKVRFGRLYREQGRAILTYALRRVEHPEDAADVVAETFLVAWRRLEEMPIGAGERLWLYAVARRVAANLHRAEGRRTRLAERDAQPDCTLVKETDPEVVVEWKVYLRPSRAAAAKLAKPLGDVALEPYAHEIAGLRRRRDAARAPQCGLETQ